MNSALPAGGAVDPLAALKDIHLPTAPSWWPPAPGWWLLGGIILLLAIGLLLRELRRCRANRPIRLALREISHDSACPEYSEIARVRRLAALLRRFCLVRFPDFGTASLSGPAWIDFLCTRKPAGIAAGELECLISAPYAPAAAIDTRKFQHLVEAWIKGQRHPFIPRRRRRR